MAKKAKAAAPPDKPVEVAPAAVSPIRFADYADRWKGMRRIRDPWMNYWQNLADVLLPTQARFTTQKSSGTEMGEGIYDGTPRLALRDLGTTLDGLMKPKTQNWFDVTVDDDNLSDQDEVKRWLEIVHERMWQAIYRKDARFIQRSGEVDMSLACFGWGALWIEQNRFRNGLLFKSFHNSMASIAEGTEGIIDQIAVEEMFSPIQARAIYERVGKPVPSKVTEALRDSARANEKTLRFVQIVVPAHDRLAESIKVPAGMAFASCVLDIESEGIVAEMGFHEFPAAVPRWETSPGEIYPRSPGMMALPDARTLQAMGKTMLIGGQRAVDPPIWVQNDAVFSPLRTYPGGVTVIDASDSNGGQPVGAFPVSTNIPIGREMQADYRAMVEAALFKNVFKLPVSGPAMTAYEVAQRRHEFIRIMGPVFGRLETDYIGHIVERVFGIMERGGAFPPRPDVLMQQKITFRFQSPIQQARKQIEVQAMSEALTVLSPLAQTQPGIFDNFDGDEIARDVPESVGMPQKWLRSIRDRDAFRQQKEQASALAASLASAQPVSAAIKNVAQANAAGS